MKRTNSLLLGAVYCLLLVSLLFMGSLGCRRTAAHQADSPRSHAPAKSESAPKRVGVSNERIESDSALEKIDHLFANPLGRPVE